VGDVGLDLLGIAILAACFETSLEVGEYPVFLGVVAMQFQTEVAESGQIHASLDHLQGGQLLGYEQDAFVLGQRGSEDVGDGL
jgi:hypothetical protein